MAISEKPSVEPIRLHFSDQTKVVVTPEDEDRFMTTAADAARACEHVHNLFQWKQEFDRLLAHVHAWCKVHRDDVSRAYLAATNEGLDLFILTKGSDYRFDFDDPISTLDIDLANRFKNCPSGVTHFPDTSTEPLSSFFDPSKALQLYG